MKLLQHRVVDLLRHQHPQLLQSQLALQQAMVFVQVIASIQLIMTAAKMLESAG